MPTCLECHGKGSREIKKEIMSRCPDCDGSKQLSDGTECTRCDRWGEAGTGKFKVEAELCRTCWGSGQVTEGSLTVWFLVWVVPVTLLLLGGGTAVIWLLWGNSLLVAIFAVIVFMSWGYLMYRFVGRMPGLGEISATNWFLIRAVPTTISAIGAGVPVILALWEYLQNPPAVVFLGFGIVAAWAVLIYYYISRLPE